MTKHRYLKFTGDYAKLKSMGYTFQKLFARNYQQWNNGIFRIWRKGTEVTCDRTNDEAKMLEAILAVGVDHVPVHVGLYGPAMVRFYINEDTGKWTLNSSAYKEWCDNGTSNGSFRVESMTRESLKPLADLIRLGWVEINTHD